MRAVGHYGEDPAPASFEKELPFGGLGIGLKGGPNGIGRPLPGLGETSVVPGKKPPDLNAEIIRRDPVPDNATMTPRPVDVPRDGGRTSYRVELPDGGVTKH